MITANAFKNPLLIHGTTGSPLYVPNWLENPDQLFERLMTGVPWRADTEARKECFMTYKPYTYQYGTGRGVRSYTSVPFDCNVNNVMDLVNYVLENRGSGQLGPVHSAVNGCFLNRYDDQSNALGWHADNFEGMDHTIPVVVVSLGQPREIWFRKNGDTGIVPPKNRQLLENGSLLIMPPGYQHTHQHRIPKGDRSMKPRISLTFRAFKDIL